jgi:CheY-like chemotaxis protein
MQQETILVVEDFLAVQQFLRETLESEGYKTLGATNGNRAYEILTHHGQGINLILTDYHMPDSTGYDLLKKIKANSDLEKIPVIFLTAESNPEIIKKAKEVGFTSWIKKPYRSEVLLEEIKKTLLGNSSSH